MGNAADTLVSKNSDRISQLKGPVYNYLNGGAPYNSTPQDLYMQVFYPVARKWPIDKEFSPLVQKQNPGIRTVRDYVQKVEKAKGPTLTPDETAALKEVALKLNVPQGSLYKLIAFESSWNPQARNNITGARGLIQFMPKTALWMGYKEGFSVVALLVVAGLGYIIAKKFGYI